MAEQVEELAEQIEAACAPPVAVIRWSWGAWLGCLLASRRGTLVKTLVLVGSGPLDAHHAKRIKATKMSRLSEAEHLEFSGLDPREGDAMQVARFIELSDRSDSYARDGSPLPEVIFDGAIHSAVWSEADWIRRDGTLLREIGKIRSPVTALHGDHDPRSSEGVRAPLAAALPAARFVLIDRFGHKPRQEVYARDVFSDELEAALAG